MTPREGTLRLLLTERRHGIREEKLAEKALTEAEAVVLEAVREGDYEAEEFFSPMEVKKLMDELAGRAAGSSPEPL